MLAAYAVAVRASGSEFFASDTWIKWDGGHYMAIATTGYEFMSCAAVGGHAGQWCGNAGWFPGYPFLVGTLHDMTGADVRLVAVLVSQTFTVLSLVLVWNLFLSRRNPVVLLLCAFAPGTYFFLVVFPMSMAVCFMLVTLWAQRQQHYVTALLSGAVVGFTYPSGICLTGALASTLVIEHWRGRPLPARAWLGVAGPVIGFCLVLLVHHMALGLWNAFFLRQEKYQHGINNPWAVLRQRSAYIWVWKPGWQTGIQSLTAAALVLLGVAATARAAWRRAEEPGDVSGAVHGLTYWLFPLVLGGSLSPYRAESLLMPAVAGLQRVPLLLLIPLLLAALAIWMVMATEFAHGWLI